MLVRTILLVLLICAGCTDLKNGVINTLMVSGEPLELSEIIWRINAASEAKFYSFEDHKVTRCDREIFTILQDTSWNELDTIYTSYIILCSNKEVYASGTHTNTLVKVGNRLIGYNVGRSYVVDENFVTEVIRD